MRLSSHSYVLKLRRAFGISRSVRTEVPVILIRIEHNGISGYGECSPNSRYGESVDSCTAILNELEDLVLPSPEVPRKWIKWLREKLQPGNYAVIAGLDMAYWDWLGKYLQTPIYQLLGAQSATGPESSYTIGLDDENSMREKLLEARDFPVLKVKLGTEADKDRISFIRSITQQRIRVDANEGWKDAETAIDMIRFLEPMNVELIEQPLPKSAIQDQAELKMKANIPLFADESISEHINWDQISSGFHGINLKLMKSGGISQSLEHVRLARKRNLNIMIGCMIESSIANTAAAIVSLWADAADIDSFRLISNDPASGLEWDPESRILLNDKSGLGVTVGHGEF